jgi:hypothetical protein
MWVVQQTEDGQQKCDWCGRFGARRFVEDKGPNGIGGRITYTYYECATCTKPTRAKPAAGAAPPPPAKK